MLFPESPMSTPTKPARWWFPAASVCIGIILALAISECALRVYHGKLFSLQSASSPTLDWTRHIRTGAHVYDSRLGWVPAPGSRTWPGGGTVTINSQGLRRAEDYKPGVHRPLLAVGDSFTFGAEVNDGESWPAQLERRIGRPVLNGGVDGYGVDQIVLRSEMLLEKFRPGAIIVAIIGDDALRTELSYFQAWKPYFEIRRGVLTLENVPVPRERRTFPLASLRRVLGYSYLAHAVLRRLLPQWWYFGSMKRVHRDGNEVTIRLLGRLFAHARQANVEMRVVTLYIAKPLASQSRLPDIVTGARELGIAVLDLAPVMEKELEAEPDRASEMFRPQGHYSVEGNAWIARKLAEQLAPLLGRL